jgi:hypothetical protein
MTTRFSRESREAGGTDPLDRELPPPSATAAGRVRQLMRVRAALGLRPITAPALLFVPLGLVLGPHFAGALTPEVLAYLDTVVSIALAALGVFVGLAMDVRGRTDRQLFAAASAEAMITVIVVSASLLLLIDSWGMPVDPAASIVAVALGVCASASSAGGAETFDNPAQNEAARIADLDDVLPIILGGVVLAAVRETEASRVFLMTGATCLIGLAIGVAGWLLFEAAQSTAERGVFVLGTVMLIGGSAAYLGLSPLLAGMAAGMFWTYSPGRADQIIRSDLEKIQHPLVVLLLLTAGASIEFTRPAIWMIAPFVLFRFGGKLTGGFLASRFTSHVAPAALGGYLIPQGVLGIAFALSFSQVTGTPTGQAVVAAAAMGSLASEVLALVAQPTAETA